MAAWSTSDYGRDTQSEWLVKTYAKTVSCIRDVGLPSEQEAVLTVQVPLLGDMAREMRYREPLPPGNNAPTGIVQFLG